MVLSSDFVWFAGAHSWLFSSTAFVKGDKLKQFPGLTVRYMRGADPVIKLLDSKRKVVETLAIDKWNTDSVEEFFNERLL